MDVLSGMELNAWKVSVAVTKAASFCVVVQLLRGMWWILNLLVVAPPFDPLRHLPGPDAPRLKNHFREVMDPEITPDTHEQWVVQYGKTLRYHGFGAVSILLFEHQSSI